MKFIAKDIGTYTQIVQIQPEHKKLKIYFKNGDVEEGMAHDYIDIANDKYVDKEINKEWPRINREERIKYHESELRKLRGEDGLVWNPHGTGVQKGGE